jgi:2-oxoglutarate ferredoxin oxidoreductase subunit delta
MARIVLRDDRCRACELCIHACPRGLLVLAETLNKDGHHPVRLTDEEACTGCAMCALMCPHVAIVKVIRR